MKFLDELKRRNVYRVAIAYAVAGWLVLDASDVILSVVDLPDWTNRLILMLIVIGFVPTLIAAWALELTPEGLKLDRDVDREATAAPSRRRTLDYWIVGMLVVVIGGLIVERVFFAPAGEAPPLAISTPLPDRSVAVLPFADLTQARDQEWFADGLAEEIMNALARTPEIMVSSRTSAFSYKGTSKAAPEIAEELGVAHVLEGSIRGSNGRLRITAQLIRASDGFHLWSQTYDDDADDVIGIQEDVALKIANALRTTMNPEALEDMMRVGTRSVRAYRAYQEGLTQRRRSVRTADNALFQDAYEQFELAREIDPNFSAAHRQAAEYWKTQLNPIMRESGLTQRSPAEILQRFLERIDLAIETAEDPIEQSGARANKAAIELRLRTAIRRFRIYLDARPNDYQLWHDLLFVATLANDEATREEALAVLKKGGERDRYAATLFIGSAFTTDANATADYGLKALERWPNDAGLLYQTHRSLLWAMRIDEAAQVVARLDDTFGRNTLIRARQACAEGQRQAVLDVLAELRADESVSIVHEWTILTMLGRQDEATELLRAYYSGDVPYQLATWLQYPHFDPTAFPVLTQMLERENVKRKPAVRVPFECSEPS